MDKATLNLTAVDLPERLALVFRSLRKGKHICRDDVADYRDLERNEDLYRVLFQALGYELIHHGQGFYYFKGGNQLSTKSLQAMVVFMLILFQDLEDKKFQEQDRMWERNLVSRLFNTSELPHFQTSQRRSMLFEVGVTPETLHDRVIRPMARYGMLELVCAEQFQFRSPVYRFVDLCMHIADNDLETVPPNVDGQMDLAPPSTDNDDFADLSDDEDDVDEEYGP